MFSDVDDSFDSSDTDLSDSEESEVECFDPVTDDEIEEYEVECTVPDSNANVRSGRAYRYVICFIIIIIITIIIICFTGNGVK